MMAKKENTFPFTVSRLNNLQPTKKRYFVYDDKQPGLRLYVTPTGNKSFQFQVRSKELGKVVSQTLGKFSKVNIKEAREKAASLLSKVNAGSDIEQSKRDEKQKRLLDPTVSDFATEYIERYAKERKKTWKEDQRILNYDIIPEIGKVRMNDVKKRHIIAVLDRVQSRGSMVSCNRTLAVLSKMFGFALERDVIEHFPVYGIKKRGIEKSRDRIISDDEVKVLWESLDNSSVNMLIKFLLITGQRTGETRQMQWNEIDGDVWTIPGDRTKNGMTHVVPLSSMALEIIDQMKGVSKDQFVFPSRKEGKCLYENAAAKVMYRLVNKHQWEHFIIHDLRRTFRSQLSSLGVSQTVAERLINHKQQGIVGVYDRYEYLEEKKVAMQKWADKLIRILTGKHSVDDNVIPFVKRG